MKMKYNAIVSARMYHNGKGSKEIDILNQIDNDYQHTNIYDDIEYALIEQIKLSYNDCYIMAYIESECIEDRYHEGSEWSVNHEVISMMQLNNIYERSK